MRSPRYIYSSLNLVLMKKMATMENSPFRNYNFASNQTVDEQSRLAIQAHVSL